MSRRTLNIVCAIFLLYSAAYGDQDFGKLVNQSYQEQVDFCANKPNRTDIEFRLDRARMTIDGKSLPIYAFVDEDGMSSEIRLGRVWEAHEIQIMSEFLKNYRKKYGINDPRTISMLDIGANVGVFMLAFGAKGYKVFAFEPIASSVYAMRKSLCENPQVDALLFGYGLSNNDTKCDSYAFEYCLSNTFVFCGGYNEEASRNERYKGMKLVQSVDLYRLDNFAEFLPNIVAIKLDVEGYEPYVIEGGMNVFMQQNVSIVLMEFDPNFMNRTGRDPFSVIKPFIDAGFSLRLSKEIRQPVSSAEALDIRTYKERSTNVFLIQSTELDNLDGPFPTNKTVPKDQSASSSINNSESITGSKWFIIMMVSVVCIGVVAILLVAARYLRRYIEFRRKRDNPYKPAAVSNSSQSATNV